MKGRVFRNQSYSLKSRNNSSKKSLYVFFETNAVKNGETKTLEQDFKMLGFGVITHKKPQKSYFMLEIDASQKDKSAPHVHIWRASENKMRISDTRSQGIDIFSGVGGKDDVRYISSEPKDKRRLKPNEIKEVCGFLNEENNRFAIFCMIDAYKKGKKLPAISFNIDEMLYEYTESEFSSLIKEFSKLQLKQTPQSGYQYE